MITDRKRMIWLLLILGALIASGCTTISKESMQTYNEAKELFRKAAAADAKKCAPCQYATAEAYLALADEEVAERDEYGHGGLAKIAGIVKEKSLEALRLTPCEVTPSPPPAAPPSPPLPPPAPSSPPSPPLPPSPSPPQPPPAAPPVFDNIYFGLGKTNISPTAAKVLDRNGAILKANPDIKVEIGGHTDSSGSEKANQKISEKRAESVKRYLMDKFNIPADRMVVKGYGSKKPIADNKTKGGRAKNRRVEFVELKVIP